MCTVTHLMLRRTIGCEGDERKRVSKYELQNTTHYLQQSPNIVKHAANFRSDFCFQVRFVESTYMFAAPNAPAPRHPIRQHESGVKATT